MYLASSSFYLKIGKFIQNNLILDFSRKKHFIYHMINNLEFRGTFMINRLEILFFWFQSKLSRIEVSEYKSFCGVNTAQYFSTEFSTLIWGWEKAFSLEVGAVNTLTSLQSHSYSCGVGSPLMTNFAILLFIVYQEFIVILLYILVKTLLDHINSQNRHWLNPK